MIEKYSMQIVLDLIVEKWNEILDIKIFVFVSLLL